MIQILFFAQLKELLGASSETLDIPAPCSVADIKHALIEKHQTWSEHLSQTNIMCAVNQTMVEDTHMVNQGDEVALFPPVTGG